MFWTNIFLFNISWMFYNLFLAVLPIFFGIIAFRVKSKLLKFVFFLGWILFVPNSLYILTDLIHLEKQWTAVDHAEKLILSMQYFIFEIIGIISFLASIYLFEKLVLKELPKKSKRISIAAIFLINFLIGFGVVLGRIQRLNSWDVFTNSEQVINDSIKTLSSLELIILSLIFGVIGNVIYFLFRNKLLRKYS